jgi:hypothetical protein
LLAEYFRIEKEQQPELLISEFEEYRRILTEFHFVLVHDDDFNALTFHSLRKATAVGIKMNQVTFPPCE